MNTRRRSVAGQFRRTSALAGAVIAGAALLIVVPLTLDTSGTHIAAALAGKGNGKDNGRGGAGGNAHGHDKAGHGANGPDDVDGKKPKLPGSLNAANASPRALDRAGLNSRVGALGAYMDAMADYADAVARGDTAAQEAALDAAAAALDAAANKSVEISTGVVDAVNRALDGKAAGFDHTGEAGDPIHEAESEIADRINPPPPAP
jgi:hypothetical protein